MKTTKNDITGDKIATKSSSDSYRDGWNRIFGDKKSKENSINNASKKTDKKSNSNK